MKKAMFLFILGGWLVFSHLWATSGLEYSQKGMPHKLYKAVQSPPPEIDWGVDIWAGELVPDNYLIVTINEFEEAIQDFIEWKRTIGKKVFVCMRDSSDWNTNAVIDSVASYYQRYGIKYLLIIGGENEVPSIGYSDYYYGLPNDSTLIPRIYRGRIPLNNRNDVRIALGKVISYERTPVMDELFYQTGVHCAQFKDDEHEIYVPPRPSWTVEQDGYEDECSVRISEEVRCHLEANHNKTINYIYFAEDDVNPTNWDCYNYSLGDSIPSELAKPYFSWDGYLDDIILAINDGAHYVLYNGDGNANGWTNPSFSASNIGYLHNNNKLPVIFSMSSKTGMYHDTSTSITEAFLKKNDGGSVAVIAPTKDVSSGISGGMALGMFDAIWPNMQLQYGDFYTEWLLISNENEFLPDFSWRPQYSFSSQHTPIYEIGKVMDYSLRRLTEIRTLDFGLPDEWLSFHCFGDPSMRMYTNTPNIFAEPSIYITNDSLKVNVNDGTCQITFYNKATGEIKQYENNYAAYAYPTSNLSICLNREGYAPYIWDYSKDLYIQNENIQGENRIYHGGTIRIGKNVTDTRPQGDVNITNSNITIKGRELELHPGTSIDANFIFQNQ